MSAAIDPRDAVHALQELRIGVEMDAVYDPSGEAKLAALDAAMAALATASPSGRPGQNELELLSEQLRYEQAQIREAYEMLSRLGAPTNGDEGAGKRSELSLAQRIAALSRVAPAVLPRAAARVIAGLISELRVYHALVWREGRHDVPPHEPGDMPDECGACNHLCSAQHYLRERGDGASERGA